MHLIKDSSRTSFSAFTAFRCADGLSQCRVLLSRCPCDDAFATYLASPNIISDLASSNNHHSYSLQAHTHNLHQRDEHGEHSLSVTAPGTAVMVLKAIRSLSQIHLAFLALFIKTIKHIIKINLLLQCPIAPATSSSMKRTFPHRNTEMLKW